MICGEWLMCGKEMEKDNFLRIEDAEIDCRGRHILLIETS